MCVHIYTHIYVSIKISSVRKNKLMTVVTSENCEPRPR